MQDFVCDMSIYINSPSLAVSNKHKLRFLLFPLHILEPFFILLKTYFQVQINNFVFEAFAELCLHGAQCQALWLTCVLYAVSGGSWIRSMSKFWVWGSLIRASMPGLDFHMFSCSSRRLGVVIGNWGVWPG